MKYRFYPKISHFLRAELVYNQSLFDRLFLLLGISFQLALYYWQPQSVLAFVSALCGICSVIFCSQRKISTYVFGFAQVITYFFLVWQQLLYGQMAQQAFYFLTMIWGVLCWRRRYNFSADKVGLMPRHLSCKLLCVIFVGLLFCSYGVGCFLSKFTNDTSPFLDAFTTIPAFAAQILMVLAYREQWVIWLFVDIGLAIVWWKAGNYCLVVQHVFWCVNCIYGWYKWSK